MLIYNSTKSLKSIHCKPYFYTQTTNLQFIKQKIVLNIFTNSSTISKKAEHRRSVRDSNQGLLNGILRLIHWVMVALPAFWLKLLIHSVMRRRKVRLFLQKRLKQFEYCQEWIEWPQTRKEESCAFRSVWPEKKIAECL